MSVVRMEQAPAVRPKNLHKEAAVMPPNTRILTLFGIIVFLWLVTFGFLVITTTWVLINLRDIKTQKAPGINLKEL
jgi:hypothetical protein